MDVGDQELPGGGLTRAGGVFESDELIARVNRAMRAMWSRLDSLPCTDPFWSRTNRRPTWYKVQQLADDCLAQDMSDEVARWALIGFEMHAGSFSGLQLIAEEAAVRDEALHDLIAVAEWVWLEVGVDPAAYPDLERALQQVGQARLSALRGPGGHLERAAVAGSAFLHGMSFAEAIGRQRWDLFLHALIVPGPDECTSSAEGSTLPSAESQQLARARECLRNDVTAVVDLIDAAHWWAAYRQTDVSYRLGELLEAVPRDAIQRLVDRGLIAPNRALFP
ncbi:hypothetical protein Acy02nite_84570 [Actinoplanes cyaneus]|uniref:Uncharacterized protein n=1 Tax=Actinoplanes cyaneus TaxID=52696 RepID=A0A919ISR6_9ACTN|nr:hypothetical protein [Actinoplanes cyaneus]GID70576.1 hypothetical protein Acy02nite_84570 [Actinoplanes cyaneus]